MIHDSYGTTAAQTTILEDARQRVMVDLYSRQYPLEWLRNRAIDDSSNEDYSGYEEGSIGASSPFEDDGEDE